MLESFEMTTEEREISALVKMYADGSCVRRRIELNGETARDVTKAPTHAVGGTALAQATRP